MSWSKDHLCCIECGTSEAPHKCRGFCCRCYSKMLRENRLPPREHTWCKTHDACIKCGRSDRKHQARGECKVCYNARVRGFNIRTAPVPVVVPEDKPILLPNTKVQVPKWDLYGTLVARPYLFYGQRVCDIRNQYGEKILQIPLHLVKFEVAN